MNELTWESPGGTCGSGFTPYEEKKIVDDLMEDSRLRSNEGDLFYLISTRWYSRWKQYVDEKIHDDDPSSGPLGPIDNSDIVEKGIDDMGRDPQLLEGLEEGEHYALIPEKVWETLFEWYKGGPALPRKLISLFKVEIYPLQLESKTNGSTPYSAITSTDYGTSNFFTKQVTASLAGLKNLENTCYMNSVLQCLVHTPPLVKFFLQDYSREINDQKPLAARDGLAAAFVWLLRKLLPSGRTPIAPDAFKEKLVQLAPKFKGRDQHDSLEFLDSVFVGLHDDLNRMKYKPFLEMEDCSCYTDEEAANQHWRHYKAQNDSVIVDVFWGQYKSTLTCPECNTVSINPDTFTYLSLPVPSIATRPMQVTVLSGNGSGLPIFFNVLVPEKGYFQDLKQALATKCCLKSNESLLLADVNEHEIFTFLEHQDEPLFFIQDQQCIVAYRFPEKKIGKTKLQIVETGNMIARIGFLELGNSRTPNLLSSYSTFSYSSFSYSIIFLIVLRLICIYIAIHVSKEINE